MNILCPRCQQAFELLPSQLDFFHQAIDKSMTLIMLECQHCHYSVPINPLSSAADSIQKPQQSQLLCPIKGCTGLICELEPQSFGCGECGSFWQNKLQLIKAIEQAIQRYPYRKAVYRQSGDDILPMLDDEIPADYADWVRQEWAD